MLEVGGPCPPPVTTSRITPPWRTISAMRKTTRSAPSTCQPFSPGALLTARTSSGAYPTIPGSGSSGVIGFGDDVLGIAGGRGGAIAHGRGRGVNARYKVETTTSTTKTTMESTTTDWCRRVFRMYAHLMPRPFIEMPIANAGRLATRYLSSSIHVHYCSS